jgi:hypothetical protein
MNIDERLEKLAERHEALTQSVELLALTVNKHDSNFERLESNLDRLEKISEANSTIIGVLSRAVLIHEERLDRLEGDTAA